MTIFVICFFILGYLGTLSAVADGRTGFPGLSRSSISASSSACRGGRMDKFKPVPDRVTMK